MRGLHWNKRPPALRGLHLSTIWLRAVSWHNWWKGLQPHCVGWYILVKVFLPKCLAV